MRAHDRRRTPFREFVLKLHTRCNLACDYCYMYELADTAWRQVNSAMSDRVLDRVCERIADHVGDTARPLRVVLHGGEPMMVGVDALVRASDRVRAAVAPQAIVDITVQTNGVLLDDRVIDRLCQADIRIGVSLDGDRQANDRHRRYANGRSSFDAVDRALRWLSLRPDHFAGILSVVDLDNDPVSTFDSLLQYDPPAIDFLLPHGNWTTPPPRWSATGGTPYGDWLVAAFDRWYDAPVQETRVRFFEEVINLALGGASRVETIGLSPVATVVVDVDGAYEQIDTLRSTYPGAVDTGMNVFDHSLDEVLEHPEIQDRQIGLNALSDDCLACPLHRICGGGYYPHRYRAETGFRNPSVYCADLGRLIRHVLPRVRADLAAVLKGRLQDGTPDAGDDASPR